MDRTIVHIDVTDFRIAVERILEPRLKERPTAVAIEATQRSLILATSREARHNGVYNGMPLSVARKNCPDLTVLPPNEELYNRATQSVIDILNQFTPTLEPLRFGHAYLDMTGSGKLFGGVKDAVVKAQREIQKRIGLDTTAGLAGNKLVSKVASDVVNAWGEIRGLHDVRRGDESEFLAPLAITFLPGVRKNIRKQLLELSIHIIRELALISLENLQMLFGRFGVVLHQRANGVDNRPVRPPRRSPEIVELEQLEQDTNMYDCLRHKTFQLLYAATRRLRQKQMTTCQLDIQIRYSDYKEETTRQRFPATTDEQELVRITEDVFKRAITRRVCVRKITLRLRGLISPSQQLSLFDSDHSKFNALVSAMDKIRNRFGENAIRFGRAA